MSDQDASPRRAVLGVLKTYFVYMGGMTALVVFLRWLREGDAVLTRIPLLVVLLLVGAGALAAIRWRAAKTGTRWGKSKGLS